MPVTVRAARNSGGGFARDTHEKATNIQVAEGHLFLSDRGPGTGPQGQAVAVYAPGQWIDAVVDNGAKG